jgi:hypothetical protein
MGCQAYNKLVGVVLCHFSFPPPALI